MKGKIYSWKIKTGRRYGVSWYHAPHRKTYKIPKFDGRKMWSENDAVELRSCMRDEYRRGVLRIEKYINIRAGFLLYLDEWLETIIKQKRPNTYAGYKTHINKYINPFFGQRNIGLHEVDLMLLFQFCNWMDIEPIYKERVIATIKSAIRFAKRSGVLQVMPDFPSRKELKVVKKPIEYIPEPRQLAIIDKIDPIHRPLFHWIRLHLRRPGEARALHKEDYNNGIFTIKRNFSKNVLVTSTKTHTWFEVPMAAEFFEHYEQMRKQPHWLQSKYFFVNPKPNMGRRYYSQSYFERLWKAAADECGETITPYRGLVSSAITHLSGMGFSDEEISTASGKSPETVRSHYKAATLAAKRSVLDRKVIKLEDVRNG